MPLLDWDAPATWKDPRLERSAVTHYFDRFPSTRPHINVSLMDFPRGWHMRGEPQISGPMRNYFGLASNKAGDLVSTLQLQGKSVALIGAAFGWTVEGLNLQGVNAVGTDTSAWILGQLNETEEAAAREALANAGITGAEQDTFELQCSVPLTVPLPLPFVQKIDQNPGFAAKGRLRWTIRALDMMQRSTWGRPGRGAVGKLLGEDGTSQRSRRTIANAVGGSLDYIITEYVLPGMADDEALQFCAVLAELSSRFGRAGVKIVHLVNTSTHPNRHPDLNWKPLVGANSWRSLLDSSNDAAIIGQELRRDEVSGAV